MTESVIQADCLEYLKTLPDNSLDAVVTDPPYELGFMGKTWDNTGIANSVELWSQVLRVLKPGGHLLSFGGTRTYHRMASAIEDAGFEVRDMIEWVYGSGFPKSLNIGKAVDKLQGNERIATGEIKHHAQKGVAVAEERGAIGGGAFGQAKDEPVTKGTSEWEGWGTALKPAHEPICMARKPIEKGLSVAENCLKYGTGGINIDESRVGTGTGETKKVYYPNIKGDNFSQGKHAYNETVEYEITDNGRFPANLIHDNSEEVRECFPDIKGKIGMTGKTGKDNSIYGKYAYQENRTKGIPDSGNASRFFKSILYYPKASKRERNKGCEGLEDKQWAASNQAKAEMKRGNDFEGHEVGDWNKVGTSKNNHPTVKPIALMEYLIQMVTKQGQTVLDPFAGSGTTLVAAFKTGRGYIGIEKEEQYIPIINARLEGCKKSGATIPLCLML